MKVEPSLAIGIDRYSIGVEPTFVWKILNLEMRATDVTEPDTRTDTHIDT